MPRRTAPYLLTSLFALATGMALFGATLTLGVAGDEPATLLIVAILSVAARDG